MSKETVLTSINLTQFDNYRNSSLVHSLISLSSDFFSKHKVMNATLFLESSPSFVDTALSMLSEASGMDFKYRTFKSGSIKEVKALSTGC